MKHKSIWLPIICMLVSLHGFSQRPDGRALNGLIEGRVEDSETGKPLEFATVSVLRLDSSLVTGSITDSKGLFSITVKPGNYLLRVQFVTFEDLFYPRITINRNSPEVFVDKLRLAPSTTELSEVVVQAERTQMELTLDKKVYNVGKDLSNLGGSASDLLDNLPSVTVDLEGNVLLRGSSNVRVLIDGKPSGLVGLSSADALRQMQGNLIERVEIVTNPSARYDAEGQAGIINIVLKKEKKKGVNGSFQLNTGYPNNHGASANMNLRRDWVNFFINYGTNYTKAPGQGFADQQFNLPDTTYRTTVGREHRRGGLNNSVRFGADFFLNEHSTVTTAFLYRYADGLNETEISYRDFDEDDRLMGQSLREDDENEYRENLEYSINYTRKFTRKDHQLTADIQFQNNHEIEQSDIGQFLVDPSDMKTPEVFQYVRNDEGEKRLMIQSDYIQPFSKQSKLELGFRSTFRDIKNIYEVKERLDEDATFVTLDTFSTDFAYNEDVHALYGIVSSEIDRLSVQFGLRSETSVISTEFIESSANRNWNYTNLFPSAFFTYKLVSENQFQLSYSRRIQRPRFRLLNPFSSFSDNRNFRVGNPELQPEFTDSYELGFLQNLQESSIYYGLYYRHTDQNIHRITLEPNDRGERVRIPYNIGTVDAIGLEINVSHEFTKWYRVTGNFNFFRQNTDGMVGDSISLAAEARTFNSRINNVFKFKNWFDAQVNVSYRAPENQPQGVWKSMTVVDIGLTRDIWNNKGTLALGLSDVFNSRKWRSTTELPTFNERSEWQWRIGPMFTATLTYRLNQRKQRERSRRSDFSGEGGFK